MSKLHVSLVTLLIAGLTACLAGGPAQTEREHPGLTCSLFGKDQAVSNV